MELPTEVLVHNTALGMKGTRATLLQISPLGYYEVNCQVGERVHRVLLPVSETSLISRQPEEAPGPEIAVDIER